MTHIIDVYKMTMFQISSDLYNTIKSLDDVYFISAENPMNVLCDDLLNQSNTNMLIDAVGELLLGTILAFTNTHEEVMIVTDVNNIVDLCNEFSQFAFFKINFKKNTWHCISKENVVLYEIPANEVSFIISQ